MAAPTFYNQGDQDIYNSGQHFVPQEKYRLGYTPPAAPEVIAPVPGGITNTNAFNNSGGNNFNPAGNAFGYGSPVSEVNVRTFNPQSNDPTGSVARAQETYNQFEDIKDKSVYPNYKDINNQIMDNRQNYQANYKSPYEDSIDLGYQGTLGNKGRLNRFKNKVGDAAKFVGGLLPFPLNIATKFLPQGNDNGPGGGTYGIGGLSDAQKEQYNTLAGQGMLFNGQNGFKTLTGKNFNAKNYAQGQIDIYNKKGYDEYTVDEDDVYDASGKKLTGFLKKQYLEASSMYKTTEKQKKEAEEQKKQEEETKAANDLRFKQEQDRLDGLVGTTVIDRNTGTSSVVQNESGGNDRGTSRRSDHAQAAGLGSNAGSVRAANTAGTGSAQSYNQNLADGGRAGYFFGGRVNYKVGGRTDAGPNRTTASHSTRGQINESGQQVSGGQTTRDNNGGNDNNPPVSNYDYSKLVDQYKEEPDYTLGNIELNKNLTSNTRLNTILNLQKTVEDKKLAGQLELDKRLGPVDTRLTYGTDQKPKLSASYMNFSPTFGGIYANADSSDGLGVNYAYNGIGANANFDNSGKFERAGITYDNNGVALGLDTQDGASANFSKDIFDGRGKITAGGTYNPNGTYNAEGKISLNYANGGLASIL